MPLVVLVSFCVMFCVCGQMGRGGKEPSDSIWIDGLWPVMETEGGVYMGLVSRVRSVLHCGGFAPRDAKKKGQVWVI